MIKKYSLVLVACLCFVLSGFGQATIFSENMGSVSSTTAIASHTFQNSATLTFTGTGDVRNTLPSTGYTGFSGNGNVFITSIVGRNFEISGISTIGYNTITLSLGHFKSTTEGSNELAIEVSSDGTTYTPLSYSRATGTLTANWILINPTGTIPSTNNLRIRFRNTSNTDQFRIDDIRLTGIVTSTNFVDYCNLQFPQNGNVTVGTAHEVFARVYELGVTDGVGQGANITGWIGYSTSNTDPSTWTNWVLANYNLDAGNDDEYKAFIGAALPSGTYYYASRFQIDGGPYRYGGLGGFWNATSRPSGILSVDTPDFVNLQFPGIGTINLGGAFVAYGQVFEQGVTPGAGQGAGIVAQIGYSPVGTNSNPNTWPAVNWISATYNAACSNCNSGQNDEYSANLGGAITAAGTYYYATRFRLNGGAWLYGGILSDGSAGSFWNGTTYISGVLTVQAPNIDIERNTNASIANGAAENTGNNTFFATTVIGNSTAPKTYFIHNEGTANLVVTSLTSSNATEFPVTLVPNADFPSPSLPLIIAPGKMAEFEIVFSPNSILPSPTRTSTITVRSNDTFKDPYTFGVRGTADCEASALTINPSSGPVGAVVTVQGTNFGAATTAKFNGTAVTALTVLSPTMIEVTVPFGATTGSLEVTNQIGCKSSAFFTIINNLITSCQGTGTLPSALFISEVTDKGSGSHSYIEIYNGTGATVDMSALSYQVRIHNNGAITATASINLTGTIANNTVKVIAIGGADATTQEGGHAADFFSGTGGINDDDHIRLYRGATWVDLWGETTGNAFTVASKDYVYRRKNFGITVPSTTWNPNDWDAFTPVDYSNIGTYDYSVGIPPTVTVQPIAPISSCDLTATLSVSATEGFSGGLPLAYQWYVSAPLPAATAWTAISNDGVYSGANSSSLSISNSLNLDNYQFYCQIRENAATCYTASNAVRVKVLKSTWDGTNWSPSALTTGRIAVLNGNYDMTSTIPLPAGNQPSFSACQLIVNPTFTLTIDDNKFVEVANNITVDGNIIVRSKGALVQNNNAGVVNGAVLTTRNKIVVEKMTALINNWYEYTYWSSPVSGETAGTAFAESNANRRFWYNAANFLDSTKETGNNNATVAGQDDIDDNGDDWALAPAGMTLLPGVGYASTLSSSGFTGSNRSYKFTFEGPFNNGIVNVPIYRNDSQLADNNWNFIGNPYPSAISVDNFLSANTVLDLNVPGGSITGAIFLWSQNTAPSGTANGNENQNFAQSDYAIINGTGEAAGGDGVIPSRYIPSGQGFFVAMANAAPSTVVSGQIKTANVTFNNAMRVTGNNNQFFRTSEQGIVANKLWVNLTTNNGVFNQILVGYINGATDGNDGMYYDAAKNLSTGASSIIYTLIGENTDLKLGIQGKDPNSLTLGEIIPLGFYTSIIQPTTYRLSIANIQGEFLTTNTVYLKDKLLNVTFNLSASEYVFSSQPGEFNNRFEIVFRDQVLSVIENEITSNQLSIIELPNGQVKFVVENDLNIQSVEIIDLLGRTLYNLKGNNASEVYELSNLSQAAYIAKVTLSNGQVISKRAVKRF